MQSRLAHAAAALMAAGTLAACGGSDGNSGSSGPADSGAAGGSETGTMVTVDETDFALELSTDTFTPGVYTFTITNSGGTSHALEIEGPGVEDAATEQLAPGDTGELTVTLESGDYTVYCPVANHADMGMTTTITVD